VTRLTPAQRVMLEEVAADQVVVTTTDRVWTHRKGQFAQRATLDRLLTIGLVEVQQTQDMLVQGRPWTDRPVVLTSLGRAYRDEAPIRAEP
jgi:hypothetical protein